MSTPETEENTTLPPSAAHEAEKHSPLASILLKLWNLMMILSTIILCFYVFVLKDNSVVPFVILGLIGLCIPPIVGLFRTMARNKRLREEHEKRMHEAQLARIREARERDAERQKREQIFAQKEAVEHEAIKNTDVTAIVKNTG